MTNSLINKRNSRKTEAPNKLGHRSQRVSRELGLRRFTKLSTALETLKNKEITLTEPWHWIDTNDTYFLEKFKKVGAYTNVFAMCFAESEETFHHWQVFSPGMDGVCIEFDKTKIENLFSSNIAIIAKSVKYCAIKDLESKPITLKELPFCKRLPYGGEKEFRVVYFDNYKKEMKKKSFKIEVNFIKRITVSPFIIPELFDSVKHLVRSIDGCENVQVYRSTLVGNRDWKKIADRVSLPA